jgi:3-oxoacyl-[acyl-carrier-protein] synthase II
MIPPTLNLEHKDEAAENIDIVHGSAREAKLDYAISNGFGFGGVNASILLKRWV